MRLNIKNILKISTLVLLFGASYSKQSYAQELGLDEEQINNAYRNYWSQPVQNWDTIIQTRRSDLYDVVRGDTLSGLSMLFFGTENYWPKIWSLNNPKVKNPHLIYVGDVIYFYTGNAETGEPPAMVFNTDPESAMAQEVIAFSVDEKEVRLPPLPSYRPVLGDLPSTFRPFVRPSPAGASGIISITRDSSPIDNARMSYKLGSFVEKKRLESSGDVIGFRNVASQTHSTFDTIYVEAKDSGSLVENQVYSVALPQGGVKPRAGGSFSGVNIYQYIAEIQILKNLKDRLYVAKVLNANNLITRDSIILPGRIPDYDLSYGSARIIDFDSAILRGNFTFGKDLYSIGSVVYLDSGANEGLTEGTILRVKEDRKIRNFGSLDLDVTNVIGLVKVVKVIPNFSTAIVVSLEDYIVPGDKTLK